MNFPFNEIIEIICLLFAFVCLTNQKAGFWQWFRWFLLFTVLVEISGGILRKSLHYDNHWLYNLYLPIETIFKGLVLYRLCRNYFNVKVWLIAAFASFSAIYLYESFTSGFREYSMIANNITSVSFIVISCLFFYYFLQKEEYVNIYMHPPFWVVAGLFLFYFGSTSCNIFYTYLADINARQNIPVRYFIFVVLNFIFYSCWSYSFLCKYRQTTSSSLSS
ncbi:hypothetical protein [Sediminibacterium ginsengisoli]|uniref:Uncharacterized protein n=1 Tax=Sediminibacterium ginsengisoli TaxID=413434 RepID=A0A1T4M977_9BACT|nr:hypothetical protein [Sediminibacterium ginsengisoli]SJZ63600.1 hypothetical protein SAMN04488132_103261 [Sediminibacterium ginsengisoli]